ncbi:MAG: hypothetical protein MUC92_07965 [Fimbriimonadaceae bacterium]|jgi:hypothetical protein|nr:hypothetical protein [Fimbriimonadaceae bacterium]
MKKEIPVPLIVLIVLACVALAGFFIFRGTAGPPEFESAATPKRIPEHIFNSYSPADQQRLKEEGYEIVKQGEIPNEMKQNPYASSGATPPAQPPGGN